MLSSKFVRKNFIVEAKRLRHRSTLKRIAAGFATLGLLINMLPTFHAMAAATPSIAIDSITDGNGLHLPPFDFSSCDTNPLFNPISISGSGVGTAPPGQIDQYHVSVDWGDGNVDTNLGTFTPPSGQSDFTYTFSSPAHVYTTTGSKNIRVKLYHVKPTGNDNQGESDITISSCVHVPPPTNGSITVTKIVDGGTAQVSDFALSVGATPVTSGIVADIPAGTYSVTETGPAGYTPSFSGDCDVNGSVTIVAPNHYDCTMTNTFDQVAPTTGTLHVVKSLPNDNGGTATADQFFFQVNGGANIQFEADGTNDVVLDAGTYDVTEVGSTPGYATTYDNCASVVVPAGGEATCTITNDDIAPTLTVFKEVVNNSGTGTSSPTDFPLFVDGVPVVMGETNTFNAGIHTVTETNHAPYALTGYSGDCQNGQVVLTLGENETCTLTNDDIAAPPPGQGQLVINKVVVGSNALQSSFTFLPTINGVQDTDTTPFIDDANGGPYTHPYDDGTTFSIVESPLPAGYTVQYDGCEGTIAANVTSTCTVTNTFIPINVPPATATLTVITHFDNSNGTGTLTDDNDADDTLDFITDSATVQNHNGAEAPGFDITVAPGDFEVTANDVAGYSKQFIGDCDTTIAANDHLTCTVEFDDLPPNPPSLEVTPTLLCIEPSLQDSDIWIAHFGYTSNNDSTVSVPIGAAVAMDNRFSGGGLDADMGQPVNFDPGSFPDVVQVPFDTAFTITWFLTSNSVQASGLSPVCPPVTPGTLTVRTFVINDQGGTMSPDQVGITVTGVNPSATAFNGSEAGTVVTLDPGSYSADGQEIDGYTKTLSAGCLGTIASDDALTCDITYDDDVNSQGGSGSVSSSGSSGGGSGHVIHPLNPPVTTPAPTPAPIVLGETDEQPVVDPVVVPPPVVLGATDEQLPRTGVPVSGLMAIGSMLTFLVRRKQK